MSELTATPLEASKESLARARLHVIALHLFPRSASDPHGAYKRREAWISKRIAEREGRLSLDVPL